MHPPQPHIKCANYLFSELTRPLSQRRAPQASGSDSASDKRAMHTQSMLHCARVAAATAAIHRPPARMGCPVAVVNLPANDCDCATHTHRHRAPCAVCSAATFAGRCRCLMRGRANPVLRLAAPPRPASGGAATDNLWLSPYRYNCSNRWQGQGLAGAPATQEAQHNQPL